MDDSTLISTPSDRPARPPSARIVREARLLAAANLGVVGGFVAWKVSSTQGHAAEALTLAKYTANFVSYRKDLIDAGRVPFVAYVFVVVVFAVAAMGCYELLAFGVARFLVRRRRRLPPPRPLDQQIR